MYGQASTYARMIIKRNSVLNSRYFNSMIQKMHKKYTRQLQADLHDVCVEQLSRVLESLFDASTATKYANDIAQDVTGHMYDSILEITADMHRNLQQASTYLNIQHEHNIEELAELMLTAPPVKEAV